MYVATKMMTEPSLRVLFLLTKREQLIWSNAGSCYFAPFKLDIIILIVVSVTVMDSDRLTIESEPLSSEDKPFFCQGDAGKEQGISVIFSN